LVLDAEAFVEPLEVALEGVEVLGVEVDLERQRVEVDQVLVEGDRIAGALADLMRVIEADAGLAGEAAHLRPGEVPHVGPAMQHADGAVADDLPADEAGGRPVQQRAQATLLAGGLPHQPRAVGDQPLEGEFAGGRQRERPQAIVDQFSSPATTSP
jgi:hypothetical protein